MSHRIFFVVVMVMLACMPAGVQSADPASAPQAAVVQLPSVTVEGSPGDDLIGPNHQPKWAATGRFSTNTDVYVQPPYEFVLDVDYQLTTPRHGSADHLFTQEFELGLPYRFQIAYENAFEFQNRRGQETVQSIEARWAFADWGKIPLNPTLFAEYKFGIGHEFGQPAGDVPSEERDSEASNSRSIPDAFELRLLLGSQIGKRGQWALNIFNEQETGGEKETETGFSQALLYQVTDDRLRLGIEMEFIRRTDRETRSHPAYEFDIGPSMSYKIAERARFDLAALGGTTGDSPALKVFAIFSISLGADSAHEAFSPASTQNR